MIMIIVVCRLLLLRSFRLLSFFINNFNAIRSFITAAVCLGTAEKAYIEMKHGKMNIKNYQQQFTHNYKTKYIFHLCQPSLLTSVACSMLILIFWHNAHCQCSQCVHFGFIFISISYFWPCTYAHTLERTEMCVAFMVNTDFCHTFA